MIPDTLRPRIRTRIRWRSVRWVIQISALLLFLLLFIHAGGTGWKPEASNLFIRLNPLTSLANILSSRAVVKGVLLALVTVGVTFLVGRAWCGWLCPLGTILDVFPLTRLRKKTSALHPNWRKVKYIVLLGIVFAALLGNLTLIALDPITLLLRSLASGIWPALDRIILAVEQSAYQVPALQTPVVILDGFIRPALFPFEPLLTRFAALYVGLLAAIVLGNLIAQRFWCRYFCPLGAFLGLISKVALVRRTVSESCGACAVCVGECPMDVIRPEQAYSSDPSECTVCMECVDGCPEGSTAFRYTTSPADWETYDPSRREAMATLGAVAAGVFLLHRGWSAQPSSPYHILPPGAYEHGLLSRCLRCGQCIRTCPTGALQPALLEAGVDGIWSPVLVPRLGYCDFSCNACGEICPVGAIPAIPLEEKRKTAIGKAVIDRERCLAWKEEAECIVCEEMCPLPEKAIWLEYEAKEVPIQKPHVDTETCIGCGICEYKCPVPGQAAIRVYALDSQGWQTASARGSWLSAQRSARNAGREPKSQRTRLMRGIDVKQDRL